jgi:hypothetical protein
MYLHSAAASEIDLCLNYPDVAFNDWLPLSPRISHHENSSEHRANYLMTNFSERMLRKKLALKMELQKAIIKEKKNT